MPTNHVPEWSHRLAHGSGIKSLGGLKTSSVEHSCGNQSVLLDIV
jgi:hypothetical protein